MNQVIYIPYGTKKYPLIISEITDDEELAKEPGAIRVKCEIANLDQYYNMEDLGSLIQNLPDIIEEQRSFRRQDSLRIRINPEEKMQVEKLAKEKGYKSVSAYIRDSILRA